MICSPLLSCSHCPSFVSTAWGMRFAKLSIGARMRTVVDAIFYRLANVQAPLKWLCAALFYLSNEKSLNTSCHHRNLWQEPVIGTLKYLLPRNSSNRSQRRRRNSWLRPALVGASIPNATLVIKLRLGKGFRVKHHQVTPHALGYWPGSLDLQASEQDSFSKWVSHNTYIHTYVRTYVHTYLPTYLHTYIHIYIYIYLCIISHTHILHNIYYVYV